MKSIQSENTAAMIAGDQAATQSGQDMPSGAMSGGQVQDTALAAASTAAPAATVTAGPVTRASATMEAHRRMLATVPDYAKARADIEREAQRYESGAASGRYTGITRIPVVVHVVWNSPFQNISNAQIISQIDVLNSFFSWSFTAGTRVEFYLADIDPFGAPTNGILRVQTRVDFFVDDDAIKSSERGGSNAWPAANYLNIWVGELSASLLGYAQLPGGLAATDGVVMWHGAFGTLGTVFAPFNLGLNLALEVGYWLNLNYLAAVGFLDKPGERTALPPAQLARMQATLDGPRSSLAMQASARRPSSSPVVSWGPNRVDVFVLGTNRAVYRKWWDGTGWRPAVTGYEFMGGVATSVPQVVATQPNRLDLFVTGTDSALYHKSWNGTTWAPSLTGYTNLGGVVVGDPRIVSWAPNRLDVFVLGTDRALYHKWRSGTTWGPSLTGYENLGGVVMEQPEIVSWGPNRLDVFVIGTDRALYHKWWNGSTWGPSVTGYERLGGVCTSAPRAVAWGPNRLDVFVTGTDGALYHKWWNGSSWGPSLTGFERLGGVCIGNPEAVAWGPNRLDVFVIGTDSALYHKWWNGSSWGPSLTGYEYMGGVISSQPRVVSWGPNRLDVFVAGTDSALYHKWWNGSSWGPSVTGYEYMGGTISDFSQAPGGDAQLEARDITPSAASDQAPQLGNGMGS